MAEECAVKEGVRNIEFALLSVYELDDIEKYDVALYVDVLEHIEHKKQALRNIINALKPGVACSTLLQTTNGGLWKGIIICRFFHIYLKDMQIFT